MCSTETRVLYWGSDEVIYEYRVSAFENRFSHHTELAGRKSPWHGGSRPFGRFLFRRLICSILMHPHEWHWHSRLVDLLWHRQSRAGPSGG